MGNTFVSILQLGWEEVFPLGGVTSMFPKNCWWANEYGSFKKEKVMTTPMNYIIHMNHTMVSLCYLASLPTPLIWPLPGVFFSILWCSSIMRSSIRWFSQIWLQTTYETRKKKKKRILLYYWLHTGTYHKNLVIWGKKRILIQYLSHPP